VREYRAAMLGSLGCGSASPRGRINSQKGRLLPRGGWGYVGCHRRLFVLGGLGRETSTNTEGGMDAEGAGGNGPAMLAGISELWKDFEDFEALGTMVVG
jgi:hypothetical protein